MQFIYFLYGLINFVFAVPVLILFIQVFLSVFPLRKVKNSADSISVFNSVWVLIPAHNESINIIPTLESLSNQTISDFKVLVVADNCVDDTAQVARNAGVRVIERFDDSRRGKGYALDYGIQYLNANGFQPEFLVIVDADCVLDKGALVALIKKAKEYNIPVQACYLMKSATNANLKTKIAEFAWLLKNYVRPLGFMRIGLPCQLTGSGMAFPWHLISQVSFATGHIVEDMKIGLEFANIGAAPVFCPEAIVYSEFPVNEEGAKTQRTRWEHGHLGIIFKDVPKVLFNAICQKNASFFAMGVDLLVPPLSLMALLMMSWIIIGGFMSLISSAFIPVFIIAVIIFTIFAGTILLFWAAYGRKIVGLTTLLSIPYYILMKLPIYIKFIFNRQADWVRSKRDK